MRRILALDTSGRWGGIALVEHAGGTSPAEIVAEIGLRSEYSLASRLLSLVDMLLAEAGWPKSGLDAYAASRGPGSFTGLRIGLGTVRGLAVASGRPGLGIGTLDAMAEAFGPATVDRVPLIDAGRDEVFGARFDPSGSPPGERIAPWLGRPERALEGGAAAVLFGSGADKHGGRLRAAGWNGASCRAPTSLAAAIGRVAAWRLEAGAEGGEGMSPLYLRPPDAKKKRRTTP